MEEKGLSPGMLLHQAWNIFKNNWIYLVLVFLVGYGIILIPSILQVWINKPSAFMQGVFTILSILVTLFVTIGWIKVTLNLVRNQKRNFFDLFRGFPVILNLLVADLLMILLLIFLPLVTFAIVALPGILIAWNNEGDFVNNLIHNPYLSIGAFISFLLAFLLSIIVFWIVALKLMLVSYFVVDCYEGPVEAMRMANRASKGVKWDLLAILILAFIIVFFGALFLGIGLLVAVPIIYLVYALAYNELIETTPWQGIAK